MKCSLCNKTIGNKTLDSVAWFFALLPFTTQQESSCHGSAGTQLHSTCMPDTQTSALRKPQLTLSEDSGNRRLIDCSQSRLPSPNPCGYRHASHCSVLQHPCCEAVRCRNNQRVAGLPMSTFSAALGRKDVVFTRGPDPCVSAGFWALICACFGRAGAMSPAPWSTWSIRRAQLLRSKSAKRRAAKKAF